MSNNNTKNYMSNNRRPLHPMGGDSLFIRAHKRDYMVIDDYRNLININNASVNNLSATNAISSKSLDTDRATVRDTLTVPGSIITGNLKVTNAFVDALDDVVNGTFSYRGTNYPVEGVQLKRLVDSAYGDNLNTPSGDTRPNPRAISNAVVAQAPNDITVNTKNCTDFFWLWGQFLDHDLDLSHTGVVSFNIPVPTGDPDFDPNSTGTVELPFTRSLFDAATGTGATPREQLNFITPSIDCSNVYGSVSSRIAWLRTGVYGKIKMSNGNMLPVNDSTQENAGTAAQSPFVSGDVRANENVALLSLHTLFARNHNWWAEQIHAYAPLLSDEEIYQRARIMVEAEVQSITVNEFLPLLLGDDPLVTYSGYDDSVDPRIANEFSTAAYRLGHSLISNTLLRVDNNGNAVNGPVELKNAFFSPALYANYGDIDYLLRGFCLQVCQKLDTKMVDSLRNFLFGAPGAGGLDLASLNIQRGRDHGLPDYNTVRVALGLAAKTTFSEITSDTALASELSTVYGGDISLVDLWVGGLAETPLAGSQLGELFHLIVEDQFTRVRDADEYWYENRCTENMIAYANGTKLSTIIRRVTGITGIQSEVMKLI